MLGNVILIYLQYFYFALMIVYIEAIILFDCLNLVWN